MERNGRVVLRAVFLIGFCWFLLYAVSTTLQTSLDTASTTSSRIIRSKGASKHTGLVYVSKRRVPNGPDPIHNRWYVTRRTRNTGQPPDRA
ncbi:CLAVATA3/ESR (CLE)-related protein 25 [Rutidosis leptorrhynchoides]|uniref:CLAVATA3/ESR (CLE)-related protein 25 n=1 Tax=Rutidosis leptorrhynchoides TaxID=125765 RepID=UPI003A99EF81